MEKYHIANNGKVLGVYTIDELKTLAFNSDTLVWKKGMPFWVKIAEIDDLKFLFKDENIPPSLNLNSNLPPPIPKDDEIEEFRKAEANPYLQSSISKKLFSPLYLAIFAGIICLSVIYYQTTKITAERIALSDIQKHGLYQSEKKKECIEEYENLLKQNPKSYEAYYLLGQLYYDLKIYKKSDAITVEKLLIKSLELKQDFFYSNALLASLYYEQKKLSDAKSFALIAQKINSEDANMKSIIFQVNENERKLKEEEEKILREKVRFENQVQNLIGNYSHVNKIYSKSGNGYIYVESYLRIVPMASELWAFIETIGTMPNGEVITSKQSACLKDIILSDNNIIIGKIYYKDGGIYPFESNLNISFSIGTLKSNIFPSQAEYNIYYKM